MSKRIAVALALVAVLWVASTVQASLINFEAPTYSTTAGTPAGNLNGQDTWTAAGSAVIDGGLVLAGAQSASLPTGATASRSLAGAGFTDVTTLSMLINVAQGHGEDDFALTASTGTIFDFGMSTSETGYQPWRDYSTGWDYFGGYIPVSGSLTTAVVATINFGTQTYDLTFTDVNNSANVWSTSGNSFVNAVTRAEAEASGMLAVTIVQSNMCLDNVGIGAVPEPTAFVLLSTGMFGLLAYAWRKRK
jgi:hypothetical protein